MLPVMGYGREVLLSSNNRIVFPQLGFALGVHIFLAKEKRSLEGDSPNTSKSSWICRAPRAGPSDLGFLGALRTAVPQPALDWIALDCCALLYSAVLCIVFVLLLHCFAVDCIALLLCTGLLCIALQCCALHCFAFKYCFLRGTFSEMFDTMN